MPTPSTPDQPIDLAFPVGGIDITTEFELQPPGTTPVAINVRAIDPGTQRNRGGARPGLSRYVNDRPGGLSSLIQHLNIIVDPTVDAMGAQDESNQTAPTDHGGDGSGILDPSNNPDPANPRNPGNRYIRPGGSGHTQNKHVGTKVLATAVADSLSASIGDPATDVDVLANDTYLGTPNIAILSGPDAGTAVVVGSGASSRIRYTPPATGDYTSDTLRYRLRATGNSPGNNNVQFAQNIADLTVDLTGGITFVQMKTLNVGGTGGLNRTDHITFNADVKQNSLIVVCAYVAAATALVVTDGGNVYTTAKEILDATVLMRMSWARAASAGPLTVNLAWTGSGAGTHSSLIVILEYSGAAVSPVQDSTSTNADFPGFPTGDFSVILPAITTVGNGRLVLGMFDVNLLSPLGGNVNTLPNAGFVIRGQVNDVLGGNPADTLIVTEGLPVNAASIAPSITFTADGSDFDIFCEALGASFTP